MWMMKKSICFPANIRNKTRLSAHIAFKHYWKLYKEKKNQEKYIYKVGWEKLKKVKLSLLADDIILYVEV